jgi:hypothetical protein
MKKYLSTVILMLIATSAYASPKDIDYGGPKDMSAQCGDAIIAKLAADDEVGSYLDNPYSVNLDWWDKEKTQVSFTIQFDTDVRDGYMTGEVEITLKSDNSCLVGNVINTSVGD